MVEHNKLQESEHEIYLEFKVGPLHFCAPVTEVEIIISPPKMSVVPISAGAMVSCFNHRGRTATVIDLHSKFGLPFKCDKNRTHIILATVQNELKGFWVDRAIDIAPLSSFEKDNSDSQPLSNAYFDFLLRDQEIILQTSFLQLFKCQGSDLIWVPDCEAVEDAQPDAVVEPVAIESSEGATDAEETQTQTACHEPQVESPVSTAQSCVDDSSDISPGSASSRQTAHVVEQHKLIPFVNQAANRQSAHSSNRRHPGLTMQANSTLRASSAQAGSTRVESIYTHEHKSHEHKLENSADQRLYIRPENASQIESQNNPASNFKSKFNNKAGNEKHKFTWLLTAVLAMLALGFTLEYLMNISARPEAVRADSSAGEETIVVKKTPFEKAEPIAEAPQIEPKAAAPIVEKSDNETLNRIAQEPEAGAVMSQSARVYELRVSEQSDSDSYAITGFSPATQQQSAVNQQAVNQQQYTHVVVKGDTLWHITRRYLHDPNRYRELAAASDIDNPHRIYPGDVVKIIVSKK